VARPGSGFSLLFEALVMALVQAMPVRAAARLVGEHDTRLWRIIHLSLPRITSAHIDGGDRQEFRPR
jgi:hypothetical protein